MVPNRYSVNVQFFVMLMIFVFSLLTRETGAQTLPEEVPILDEKTLDRTVDPCNDFYQFSCGGWLATKELPASHPRYSRSFTSLRDQNSVFIKDVLEELRLKTSYDSDDEERLARFYNACMNEHWVEVKGKKVLQKKLIELAAVQSRDEIVRFLAQLHLSGNDVFFSFEPTQDAKDATQVVALVWRGDLGLPERAYYLSKDDSMAHIRNAYQDYIQKISTLAKLAPEKGPISLGKSILDFETEMARALLPVEDLRNPNAIYNPVTVDDFRREYPHFNWTVYFEALQVSEPTKVVLGEPAYMKKLDRIFDEIPLEDLKTYLAFHIIDGLATSLGPDFQKAHFDFYETQLTGVKEMEPRWKICADSTSWALPDALGRVFVAKKFPGDSKDMMLAMIKNIKDAFAENLRTLNWMDAETRTKALEKLMNFVDQIGYPNKWASYDGLRLTKKNFAKNILNTSAFQKREELARIGKPVDRARWEMSAQTVNAYYNPQLNEIVFPAAIAQPPFFKNTAPLAANYGAMGMVMGHELTHGFDDEGRQFDAQGNLKDWWSQSVGDEFVQKAACIDKQYSNYTVPNDVHLNGQLTRGENIADLGGLKFAYRAFQKEKSTHGDLANILGFTPDQQFFVAFAQSWCSKSTPEDERGRAAADPHSPPRYRVNGVVTNLPEFAAAFACKEGAPMAPRDRCEVW